MHYKVEKELVLPDISVELATLTWHRAGESPKRDTHVLFQRLSRDHSPLRLRHVSAFDLLPRVRSVGFLPARSTVPLEPVGCPLRVIACFFDAGFVLAHTGLSEETWARHTAALASLRNKRIEMMMQELHAELERPGDAHAFLVQSLANVMLVEIARFVGELERRHAREGVVLALAPWQLIRIEKRIEASLERGYPTLSELAALCGISRPHLARAFKASTGWQIHKYIAEQRIEAARNLLQRKDCSCEDIAAQLGFGTPAYFSTVFRQATGQSPSQFRRLALAAKDSAAS